MYVTVRQKKRIYQSFHFISFIQLLKLSDYHNAWLTLQGPVSERSENSEYVNPEMRQTLGFPFQERGVYQT